MNFIRKNWLTIATIMVGAVGGYMYYYFIGCSTGSCPITSKPLNSTIYGALIRGLFFSIFKKEKIYSDQNKN
jgi:hypothetical protein